MPNTFPNAKTKINALSYRISHTHNTYTQHTYFRICIHMHVYIYEKVGMSVKRYESRGYLAATPRQRTFKVNKMQIQCQYSSSTYKTSNSIAFVVEQHFAEGKSFLFIN
ncbi:unnamed protein product [Ceratitis capitata]|uniref:(Mediterranean fruit fly) hypothetical protein n=1 Tax=Ceratitis capitata TaxID=7213 RepID=A0A811V7N7_CERCA|nr:unnamed protein product [Ceratitis capitata]